MATCRSPKRGRPHDCGARTPGTTHAADRHCRPPGQGQRIQGRGWTWASGGGTAHWRQMVASALSVSRHRENDQPRGPRQGVPPRDRPRPRGARYHARPSGPARGTDRRASRSAHRRARWASCSWTSIPIPVASRRAAHREWTDDASSDDAGMLEEFVKTKLRASCRSMASARSQDRRLVPSAFKGDLPCLVLSDRPHRLTATLRCNTARCDELVNCVRKLSPRTRLIATHGLL